MPLTGIYSKDTGAISITITILGISFESHGTLKDNVLSLEMDSDGQVKHKTLNGASEVDYQAALKAFKGKHS